MPVEARLTGLVRAALPMDQTVGVALSGGGDSVALLHLCRVAGLTVEAVTVDHALRAESAAEAVAVSAGCAALGVRHEVRVWRHGAVGGNLMDAARRARVGLIRDWAVQRGIGVVALGHTRDDQAETLLMGLARVAGIDGLAGMRPAWVEGGVRFVRPLLEAGRTELRAWLKAQGIAWIDDPTNENDRFARVRARKALAVMEPLGISPQGLATVARNLAEAREALDAAMAEAAVRLVREVAGALVFDAAGVAALPGEVRRRLVVAALAWVSRAGYAPRADAVARLAAAVTDGRDATLWGCRLRRGVLMRETKATGTGAGPLWDGRWVVEGPWTQGLTVRALGAKGLRVCKDWRATGISREVLTVTPGIWAGETLVSAPLAGFADGWSARIDAPFHLFGLSH
ncbi:MAG: tRNA lysidine(34) synthetase TilS [Tabrizicola sp.]|uniref:tRNA lysidine(34) synthetase TilS n=1 Tax=Tabrizicola sp. TaxID=2005166 RepID=UPI002737599A|nr:tRNA lysidine(34) synthetase TilS [Tabrizicola sp.]MDP3261480.1 tRNA lysidine(34) synthetase TilS [Tabrizicola sp.]MDP3649269.1 tRNA lysidine(34) synthetase TilS [Paracoccaceae bacterium]MDZ4067579.1 tRNA lysidine(34) synthetase TilS [Tabrizicola sp.]